MVVLLLITASSCLLFLPNVSTLTTNSVTAVDRFRYGGFTSPFSSIFPLVFDFDSDENWSFLWRETATVPDLLPQVCLILVLSHHLSHMIQYFQEPPGKLLIDYPLGVGFSCFSSMYTNIL